MNWKKLEIKSWINKNYKTLIVFAFIIPIITVAVVSISHVTQWYGVSNPITWAIYLSIGVEIAAMSAVAAISANIGKNIYIPFIVVTFIQLLGNVYFSYEHIDMASKAFKSWVELVSPILQFGGIEPTNLVAHRRVLAFLAGGLLPVISLSFLHMLVKFTEDERLKQITNTTDIDSIKADVVIDSPKKIENLVEQKVTEIDSEKMKEFEDNHFKPTEKTLNELSEFLHKNFEKNIEDENVEDGEDYVNDEYFENDEDFEYEDDLTSEFNEIKNGYIKPEIEYDSKDSMRDEILNDIKQTELENQISEKKKI